MIFYSIISRNISPKWMTTKIKISKPLVLINSSFWNLIDNRSFLIFFIFLRKLLRSWHNIWYFSFLWFWVFLKTQKRSNCNTPFFNKVHKIIDWLLRRKVIIIIWVLRSGTASHTKHINHDQMEMFGQRFD